MKAMTKLLAALLVAFTLPAFAQFQGDVRLTRTGVMTPASSQGVLYASTTGGGVFRGSGSSADLSFLDKTGATQISIGESTYTNNATTWTFGNNYTATRAAGAVAAGPTAVTLLRASTTFSGDAAGTSVIDAHRFDSVGSGGNNINVIRNLLANAEYSGTGTLAAANSIEARYVNSSSGTITVARSFLSLPVISGTGGITTYNDFDSVAGNLSSTGAIGTRNAYRAGNIGHATLVSNAVGFQSDDMTAATTLTASFNSAMTSGVGKWGFRHTGNANNAFNGNTRIGSTTAPTVALDVTGDAIVSGNTTLGDASGDTLTINAGTWTLGSSYTATRAVGAAAAGSSIAQTNNTTFTGDAGGTTAIRAQVHNITSSGSNAITTSRTAQFVNEHQGSNTLTNHNGVLVNVSNSGTGNSTTVAGVNTALTLSSSGGSTTAYGFTVTAPTLSSTGAVGTNYAYHAANQGHATLVTNAISYQADNSTASATLTAGFRSQQNSGTGAWGFLHAGTANNGFQGNTRIGSTTAPAATLDITGAADTITLQTGTGSVTGSGTTSLHSLAGTWNTSGVVPGFIKSNITNTASGAGSRHLELQRGGTLQFGVTSGATSTGTQIRTAQQTAPTCSANCGTSPSVTGTDSAMTVTMGSSGSPASGWVVTFNGTWATAPACTVQMAKAGMVVGKLALTAVTTTTTVTVVTNGTAPATTDMYHILCTGIS